MYEGGGVAVCAPGPPNCQETPTRANETRPLRISRLGRNGEVLSSVETKEHAIRVAPGKYEIVALGRYVDGVDVGFSPTTVNVSAGQKLEVSLEIAEK